MRTSTGRTLRRRHYNPDTGGRPDVGRVKFFNTAPRESALEGWFVRLVRKTGYGKAYKFASPGHRSVPDRIIVFRKPGGHVFLCELKRKGKKPTPKQWGEINFWRMMGVRVYVCDSKEQCLAMLAIEWQVCFLDYELTKQERELCCVQ